MNKLTILRRSDEGNYAVLAEVMTDEDFSLSPAIRSYVQDYEGATHYMVRRMSVIGGETKENLYFRSV